MELKRPGAIQALSTVSLFCFLIGGFTFATLVKPSDEFSETENRMLQQRPEIQAETIWNGDFEKDYEQYLTDQFILRNQWISLKTLVERLLFKRESKDIYFAEDGYLIEKHTGSFTSRTAQRNIQTLKRFTEMYQEQFGAGHLTVMIIPNAVDILNEKLPPFASPYDEEAYLKQIEDGLSEEVWLDSSSVLREHAGEPLYYKTDHHWKTLAAFYVYQAWAKRQGYPVPELTDYEIQTAAEHFEGTVQSKLGIRTPGDTIELFLPKQEVLYTVSWEGAKESSTLYDYAALGRKDKYAVYFGGNHPFLSIKTNACTKRKILVIKNSYANCFIPFLLGEFDEIDILDPRYTSRRLSHLITEGGYTDLLVLYNASGFAEDMSIIRLTN